MKTLNIVVVIVIVLLAYLIFSGRLSMYDNKCDETKTFEKGWRCFKDDESSFSQGVKKCENCKTIWKTLPAV
jgi:hypothetical protein